MFAEQLKRTRQSRHYSQAEIASKLGVTQQAMLAFTVNVLPSVRLIWYSLPRISSSWKGL